MQYPSKRVCQALAQMEPELRFGWFEGGDSGPHFGLIRLEPVSKVGTIDATRRHFRTYFWECEDAVALFDENGCIQTAQTGDRQAMVEVRITGATPDHILSGAYTENQMRVRKPNWAVNLQGYENLVERGKDLDRKQEDAGRDAADKMWYRYRKEEQNLPITTREEKLAAMKATGLDKYEDRGGLKWAEENTKRAAPFTREAPKGPEI